MSFPVIGIIGGGQLARMMVPAAIELGLEVRVLAESSEAPAVSAARHAPVVDYHDLELLRAFATGVDVLTFDHEHVPPEHLQALAADGVVLRPGPQALIYAQDKLAMRSLVDQLGLPNPQWSRVESVAELIDFGARTGWPVILKTPRGGYDGKGVRVVADEEAAHSCQDWFDDFSSALLAEAKVPFTRELSALVARRPGGQCRAWDIVESIQVDGVCDEVIAPAPLLDVKAAEAAQTAAMRIAEALGVVGVMAVELFETPDEGPGFMVNEFAMRPHNSGHWSMDGALTGQFEQHLRAVADLPLGETRSLADRTVMKNILGGENQDLFAAYPAALAADPGIKLHHYGKAVRPGRKLGHINVLAAPGEALESLRERAGQASAIIREGLAPAAQPEDEDDLAEGQKGRE
ncbi:5-(carboxyamino)imidazole ribonucleotide synthase [Acaricomes phytoseiuli]|uniref:5-(carboxyamino)imidazole ribonucleotide synthase n=1 Tax=Acaricomes phytoseiuli TaxID=291968 RepID=UPI0022229394|nr:5-(carboxyamino)imidazole ribonucleotide synthase [Acaricomes phytoseiuli]MCW1249877.1 5-(carboxyamino)imidazole ribonucleotide synthase [Acaricomes phytoseiuli]